MQSEHGGLPLQIVVEHEIIGMEVDRHSQPPFGGRYARDVIDVRMREQNVANRQPVLLGQQQKLLHFVAGVDQDGLVRVLAPKDESVLEERTDCPHFQYHVRSVVLAIVDDLMFTSKIKAAASGLGVALIFARSAGAALEQMRQTTPALVILDLNGTRTDPIAFIAGMKRDPALATIPTVGFVSHVRTDVIEAARAAGVDQVLARSAFTEQLAEILQRGA
jgi:CheY-like chemotaxis protein